MVQAMQIFTEPPHDAHAQVRMLAQMVQQLLGIDERDFTFTQRFSCEFVRLPTDGFAYPQDRSGSEHFKHAMLSLRSRHEHAQLPGFKKVNAFHCLSAHEDQAALAITAGGLQPLQLLP